jgi:hypothetical protein
MCSTFSADFQNSFPLNFRKYSERKPLTLSDVCQKVTALSESPDDQSHSTLEKRGLEMQIGFSHFLFDRQYRHNWNIFLIPLWWFRSNRKRQDQRILGWHW